MFNMFRLVCWLLLLSRISALLTPPLYAISRFTKTSLSSNFFGEDPSEGYGSNTDDLDRLSTEDLEAMIPEWGDHVPKYIRVTVVGRVGNDPDPRYFDDGKVVVNLSLAVRRKYQSLERRAQNIQEDATDWFNLEIWGRDAEYASKYVSKGSRIGVSGSLAVDSWIDRMSGEKRSKCTILVRDLDILETKAEAELRRGGAVTSFSQEGKQRERQSDGDDSNDFLGPFSAGTGGFF
jgi:single-strand DNA-binding protein